MKSIDLTPILQAILTLIAALITCRFIPWLKSQTTKNQQSILVTAVKIGVDAAEQIYKHGENQEKINYAIDFAQVYLMSKGYEVNIPTLKATAESICHQMKKPTIEMLGVPMVDEVPDDGFDEKGAE